MKATVDRKALADAAKAVGRFLPRIHHVDALSHFLLEAHSGIVALTATDTESGRRVEVEADVQTEGDVLVPGSFAQIVSTGQGSEVELSATDANLTVKVGRSTARLRLGRREDYPDAEPELDGPKVPIDSWHRIQAVAAASTTDNSRPMLGGVKLEAGQAIATDSYRLAYCDFTDEKDHPEVLVPARAIQGLKVEVTALQIGERHVKADVEGGAWWARLIEGAFPKWRTLAERPSEMAYTLTLGPEDLIDAIGRAHSVVKPEIPVRITPGDGDIVISAAQQDGGEFSETLACKVEPVFEGEPLTVGYNGSYLRSMVEPVASVTIEVQDAIRPTFISGGGWWNAVVMPVRL